MFWLKIQRLRITYFIYSSLRKKVTMCFPNMTKKVFLPNPNKTLQNIKKSHKPRTEKSYGPRINNLNIQMLSKAIYDQVFIEGYNNTSDPQIIENCLQDLKKREMNTCDNCFQKEVDYKIPPLKGKNIVEHFQLIGEEQIKPYKNLILLLLESCPIPPKKWVMQPGWTRYTPECLPQTVPYPLEESLVFDVEVCMTAGKTPTVATAVSNKAWYAWVNPSVLEGITRPVTSHQYSINSLLPLESEPQDTGLKLSGHQIKPKIVVGHNVSFDRARIKEQYWLNKTGTRFIDTMSLHVCVGGLTSYQRMVLKSKKLCDEDDDWKNCSSLNNLADVYQLYCSKTIKKDTRNIFVKGTMADIKDNFQKVMFYCSSDVQATYEILQQLFPLFMQRFPHPVTLAGMLELSIPYLPVNSNWPRYIEESEQAYEDLENEGKILLANRANQACQLLHNYKYKEDIWMWDEDWNIKEIKMKAGSKNKKQAKEEQLEIEKQQVKKMINKDDEQESELENRFKYLWDTKYNLPAVKTLLPGYPNWFRKLCKKPDNISLWLPGPNLISTSMQITPKLLCLTWEGFPLHYLKEKGWGFLVPFSDNTEISRKLPLQQLIKKCPILNYKTGKSNYDDMLNLCKKVQDNLSKSEYYYNLRKDTTSGVYKGAGIWCNTEIEDCCWFFKLPHKDGHSYNVGNPLAKDFLNKFSENVLVADVENAKEVLEIAKKVSYWRNNRSRILDQMVIWLAEDNVPKFFHNTGYSFGVIVPQVVVCGTLTRRAVEPTWMTASNAHSERIGSELRAMVQAPPGYTIVGADVDSQELWIASVLGDANYAKMHGATPLGWMTLSGTKSSGTDMHSVTAKAIGISRDHAKVINYARIYGAGQNFAERLLKQFNPTMSDIEARNKAQKMFALTKGKKLYYLRKEFVLDFADQPYTKWQAFEIAKACRKTIDVMFHKSKWMGGTESAMFNRLEEIATSEVPATPFLHGRLSKAIEPKCSSEDRYLPTRINWVVQSGAADFLHIMLVCMKWIMGDKIRFCFSFHDEVRYLVPEEYKYQAALALHTTNLLTRSFCSHKLGLNDLPLSVAFFSTVEVDKVLRKESKQDCITPSNPHGLSKGYGISYGEALNIYEAIEKVGGKFTCWYDISKFEKNS